ncbi:MAG: phage portal protein [Erysipelotrichaceae bacterium]|nr:phage portal protein [Erysipelotrichaceae bacterium]
MELSIGSRFKNAWNAFSNKNPTSSNNGYGGYYYRPDRVRLTTRNERSIITSVFNRIAIDVAAIDINHCQLDEDGRFQSIISSSLNECLTVEANLDQTGRNLIQDAVMSMFDEGCVAIVPVDTTFNPKDTNSYDILSLRVGKIVTWYPTQVRVEVYNERKGLKEEVTLDKSDVAIIENPLYAIMNEPNSTLQRLIRKLVLLDSIDEQSGSGKLDLIIQLPYIVKSPARKAQAEQRRTDIEKQLAGSKYGIAYTDGTEKITQLNRPVENNLMKQIEYLTSMLYSQLGITQAVLDGTADEKTMLNYYSRTVEPIVSSIVDEMIRKFITKKARTQGKTILFFRDPFKLVPVNQIAEIADKFTRNEILTSNEIRQVIGRKPSEDPKADMLINSNLNQSNESLAKVNDQNEMEGGTNIEK